MDKDTLRKKKAIPIILEALEAGEVSPTEVLERLRSNWSIPNSTFYYWWGCAQDIYREKQKKIQEKIDKDKIDATREAYKKGLKKREDRLIQLQSIIDGNGVRTYDNKLIYPSFSDRIRAHELLSKMLGELAPVKNEHTINDFVGFLKRINTK
jgi:hypothetical protein